jgi:hypothetical protein
MAPIRRHAANVFRGPIASQAGPATSRTRRLEHDQTKVDDYTAIKKLTLQ